MLFLFVNFQFAELFISEIFHYSRFTLTQFVSVLPFWDTRYYVSTVFIICDTVLKQPKKFL